MPPTVRHGDTAIRDVGRAQPAGRWFDPGDRMGADARSRVPVAGSPRVATSFGVSSSQRCNAPTTSNEEWQRDWPQSTRGTARTCRTDAPAAPIAPVAPPAPLQRLPDVLMHEADGDRALANR